MAAADSGGAGLGTVVLPAAWRAAVGSAWVEVDLDAITANTRAVLAYVHHRVPQSRLMAVVKADGYGHGAAPAAAAALAGGAEALAVTKLDEAVELRRAGITAPILVFNPLTAGELPLAVDLDVELAISDPAALLAVDQAAAAAGRLVGVHLEVDSGLGRFGCPPVQVAELVRAARAAESVVVRAMFTHFPGPPYDGAYGRFSEGVAVAEAAGLAAPARHVASSTVLVHRPDLALDWHRVGNLLYGILPAPCPELELRPVWQLSARVLAVRDLPAGATVGYERDQRLPRPTRVATFGLGLAEGLGVEAQSRTYRPWRLVKAAVKLLLDRLGLARRLGVASVRGQAQIGGRTVALLGRVFMQHCQLDVTGLEVAPGDVASFEAGRIVVSSRLARVYHRDGQPVAATTLAGPLALELPPADGSSPSAPSTDASWG